jgi:maleylacetate reductase
VLAETHQVDALLALGGGSAIGLAKAVSHAGGCRLPIIAVPTTYAGSEMTPIFGVTEPGPGGPRKVTARDRRLTPAVVIYDPDLTRTLPPAAAGASGVNALAHAIEALYSRTRQPLSSAAALHGAALIWRHLPRVVNDGAVDAYAPLFQGAHLTAVSLADVALGLHHGLCHVLGGAAGVGHGPANAIMLPHALRFNLAQTAPQLEPLAAALGIPAVDTLPEAVETWIAGLGLPRRLRDVGVPESDLPRLAALALHSKAVQTNPIPIDNPAQAEAVFRAAW